jgi:hypothetical protein
MPLKMRTPGIYLAKARRTSRGPSAVFGVVFDFGGE